MEKLSQKELESFGGAVWEGYGKKRFYFNDLKKLLGWEIKCYKTGNISSAKYRGESVSNSFASKNFPRGYVKFWYDLKSYKFEAKNLSDDDFEYAKNAVLGKLDV